MSATTTEVDDPPRAFILRAMHITHPLQSSRQRHFCITLGAALVLTLAGCGGGGSSSGSNAPGIDISGIWTDSFDANVGGDVGGLMLAVGDVAYGYEVDATTVRYFRGSALTADTLNYDYAQGRYDKGLATGNAFVTTGSGTGKLQGSLFSTGVLAVGFGAVGAPADFSPLRMTAGAANVSAAVDLRDFVGSFTLPTGSLTISASAADNGTLVGTAVNGCNWSGSINRPRADKNVWTVRLTQSACSVTSRNGAVSDGLATMYRSGSTLNLTLLAFDGSTWSLLSSSR